MIAKFAYPLIAGIILSVCNGTEIKGPQKYSVFDKNLVSEKITPEDIIKNHQAFHTQTDFSNFDGLTLGFVTPWNNHGYDIAKIFGNKFSFISPVWLQITSKKARFNERFNLLSGSDNIDKEWMIKLGNVGRERKLKVFPRVLFDGWSEENYTKLLTVEGEIKNVSGTLNTVSKIYGFAGYVIELQSYTLPAAGFVKIMKNIAIDLKSQGVEMILVIAPDRGQPNVFTSEHFDALYDHVTAFALMTYDYSGPYIPPNYGPTAPIYWIEKCIKGLAQDEEKRRKILMGLNFYGYDYTLRGSNPVIGHEYISKLKQISGPIHYNRYDAEHEFLYQDEKGDRHVVIYPTLYSIEKRLQLARALNTGIAIWELGQGLDYFYDLL